ncbi:MAG: Holliday junction resolvase RuvX [Planctomycetes bacterium]|nr:Holliday junction resolvase RuvX [Planctomycetota bacterium]
MTGTADRQSGPDSQPERVPVPVFGPLLGIDYGTRRIGVAISNDEQTISLPLENYTRRTEKLDAEWLRQLAAGYGARGIVVGLPVHMSGDEGGKAREARAFGEWARTVTSLPVTWWDERYSSATADLYLDQQEATKKKRKSQRDKLAAQVFLQSFLDSDDRDAAPVAFN